MQTVVSKDGTKIAYDIYGEGVPLIYITGAICFRNFKPVLDDAKEFTKYFKVCNYDRRGRGDSGDSLPYSMEKELEDIEALIAALGGKAYLYGHSSGAILALEAAIKMPTQVQKVFIYDPSYASEEKDRASYAELAIKVKSLLEKREHARALKTFLIGIGMPKFFVFLLPLMPGWKTMKSLAPTLAYDIELTKNPPPLEHLKNIQVPIKIMCGEKSPEEVKAVSKKIAVAIPHAESEELPKQDHMVSAKTLGPKLKAFLIPKG